MTTHGLTLFVVFMIIYCQAIQLPDLSPNGFQPIYTRKDPQKYGYGIGNVLQSPFRSECRYKSFGLTGVKITLCKNSFRYSYIRPAYVTYKLGNMGKETSESFSQIFRGLLQPRVQFSASRGTPQHDHDMCCPTIQQMRQAPYQQVDDLGTNQFLIHLPADGIFQYYHGGTCLDTNEATSCQGSCVQATSTVFLAVFRFDLDVGFSFAPFTMPSYCSCRNIGLSVNRPVNDDRAMKANHTILQQGVSVNGTTGERIDRRMEGNRTTGDEQQSGSGNGQSVQHGNEKMFQTSPPNSRKDTKQPS